VLLTLGHVTTKVTQEWLTYLLGVGKNVPLAEQSEKPRRTE
jgi:hypothetical protein